MLVEVAVYGEYSVGLFASEVSRKFMGVIMQLPREFGFEPRIVAKEACLLLKKSLKRTR